MSIDLISTQVDFNIYLQQTELIAEEHSKPELLMAVTQCHCKNEPTSTDHHVIFTKMTSAISYEAYSGQ